jgi:hypothetical protein
LRRVPYRKLGRVNRLIRGWQLAKQLEAVGFAAGCLLRSQFGPSPNRTLEAIGV